MPNRTTVAHAPDGTAIDEITLSDNGTSVSLLTIGGATRDWRVPVRGAPTSVVLGHEDPLVYLEQPSYLGAIAGRVANRVANARFEMDGKTYQCDPNEGPNMLHGGPVGLARVHWQAEVDSAANAVRFSYHSPHGQAGFPGNVDFTYVISLNAGAVTYDLRAQVDRKTPISLAQHNYYNLMGRGSVMGHRLKMPARQYVPVDDASIPLGHFADVSGTIFDYRELRALGDADPDRIGADAHVVLTADEGPDAVLCADNGLVLRMHTDQPGIQFYTAKYMQSAPGGLHGAAFEPFGGVCLEPQQAPNAVNVPGFGFKMTTPDAPYRQITRVAITEG